jgi:serine/threonine protein kinase
MCIHRTKIVHRDLKSANCLVNKHWTVKICDFGLSRVMIDSPMTDNSSAGTPEWMAPELIRNEPFTEKCDIFSLGVIMWELCTLSRPWEGIPPVQVSIHLPLCWNSCSMNAFPKGLCWLSMWCILYLSPDWLFLYVLVAQSCKPATYKVSLMHSRSYMYKSKWESCELI